MEEPRYKVSVAATLEPVTLDELRNNLRIASSSALDGILQQCLNGAVAEAEAYTGRVLLPTTMLAYLDAYPDDDEILITKGPVASLTSIQYYAAGASELTTVDSGDYQLDNVEIDARIRFSESFSPDEDKMNAIVITYVAGWASVDALPRKIKDAIILMATERYLNPTTAGVSRAAQSLLNGYKNQRF